MYPDPGPYQDNGLLTYAMNDLRNRAAAAGANYVQRSEPTLSAPWGTITIAEYAGVAYRCPNPSPLVRPFSRDVSATSSR